MAELKAVVFQEKRLLFQDEDFEDKFDAVFRPMVADALNRLLPPPTTTETIPTTTTPIPTITVTRPPAIPTATKEPEIQVGEWLTICLLLVWIWFW